MSLKSRSGWLRATGEIQVCCSHQKTSVVLGEANEDKECRPQKGIVTYAVAANRLNPLAGVMQSAIFNTFRRTRGQILYWGVPLLIAYSAMEWATER